MPVFGRATMKHTCTIAACRNMIEGSKVFCNAHWALVPRSNKLAMAIAFEAGVEPEDQGLAFAKAKLDAAKLVQLLESAKKDQPPPKAPW